MKTVFFFFESLCYKLITKNYFYYGSCPDIHFTTPIPKRKISCCYYYKKIIMFHYMHLITEPIESMIPILAIKPSHSRSENITFFKMQLGHDEKSFLVWTYIH